MPLQTNAKKGRKIVRAVMKALQRAWRAVMRRVTGRSELGRILKSNEGYTNELVRAIALSIARSSEKEAVFGHKIFDVNLVSTHLAQMKGISDQDKPRLDWCLQIFNIVNMVHDKVAVLQKTPFDTTSEDQVAQLEALWSSLQPSVRRESPGGWGVLGFQNGDRPETDFRGMGLLGLVQLVFFSQTRNAEARQILADSTNPKRYFPFAAAGINVTAFTKVMLEQRRLDTHIYEAIVKHMPAGKLPEDQEMLVSAGFTAFNVIYGDEYVEFSRFWHVSDPSSTFAFPGIFGTIKHRAFSRFPSLLEDV